MTPDGVAVHSQQTWRGLSLAVAGAAGPWLALAMVTAAQTAPTVSLPTLTVNVQLYAEPQTPTKVPGSQPAGYTSRVTQVLARLMLEVQPQGGPTFSDEARRSHT